MEFAHELEQHLYGTKQPRIWTVPEPHEPPKVGDPALPSLQLALPVPSEVYLYSLAALGRAAACTALMGRTRDRASAAHCTSL